MIGHKTFAIVIFVAIAIVGVAEAGFGNCPSWGSVPVYGLWGNIAIANEVRSEGGGDTKKRVHLAWQCVSFPRGFILWGQQTVLARAFCLLPTINNNNTNETIV